jgi:hypothetical protein
VALAVTEIVVAAPNRSRFVIAGSLGLESALNPVVSIEGLLLSPLGHHQAESMDPAAAGSGVAACSGLTLGLP